MKPSRRFAPTTWLIWRSMPPARGFSAAFIAAALACGTFACDRAPSPAGLKEWTPDDHDGEKKTAPPPGAKADPGASAAGSPLIAVTWSQQCEKCHGPSGRGDGPESPMVKAKDLSGDDTQKLTDAQIAATIRNGKGKMPKFDKLPVEVVDALVARVRSFRAR